MIRDQSGDPSDFSDRIEEAARDWIIKQDQGFTAEEQDRFFDWLAADPRNANAYGEFRNTWKELDVFVQWKPEHSLSPNPNLLSRLKSPVRFAIPKLLWGLAACLIIGFSLWGLNGGFVLKEANSVPTTVATAYEKHVLNDGSVIELNRGAQVTVNYSRKRRDITLVAGEAYFDVAKDSKRPFVVKAGEVAVEALGTAFNIDLESEQVEVLVTEGQILLETPSFESNSLPTEAETYKPRRALSEGEVTVISSEMLSISPEIEQVSANDIVKRLAWKAGLLEFTRAPLSEVVDQFNRYNDQQIVIADDNLGNLEITAAVKPDDLEAFTRLLELTLPLTAHYQMDNMIELQSIVD